MEPKGLTCSFCGSLIVDVVFLVQGLASLSSPVAHICNICIDICIEIREDRLSEELAIIRYKEIWEGA